MPTANIDALFPYSPFVAQARITGATTDKSGATTAEIKVLYTAEAFGDKITWIKFKFIGSNTAGIFFVWLTDTTGANPRLFLEIIYPTNTSSATAQTLERFFNQDDLQLKEGQQIWVASNIVTSNVDVNAMISKYQKP